MLMLDATNSRASATGGRGVRDPRMGRGVRDPRIKIAFLEDGGRRQFILVEMAHYFDTVLLPRIK